MSNISLGDLSQSFLFQRTSVTLRSELNKLTNELSSGQVSDVRTVLEGNYSYLADLERDLRINNAFSTTISEADAFATGVQTSLDALQTAASELSESLLSVSQSPLWPALTQGSDIARGQLDRMLSVLNTDLAGRNLFSGTSTDIDPIGDIDTLLTALEAEISGATTPADIRTAAQAWFDDPLGFEAIMYNGSVENLAPFVLSEDEEVSIEIRADNRVFRDMIMNAAIAALADSPALGYSTSTISAIHRDAGTALLQGSDQIISLRGNVGVVEERIEKASARNAATATSLEFARNQLLAVDTFETATDLEAVRFQLESLYTVTARLSDLALVNFIR